MPDPLSRRRSLQLLAVAAGATLLAACSSVPRAPASPPTSPPPPPTPPPAAPGTPTAVAAAAPPSSATVVAAAQPTPAPQPTRGGTLRYGQLGDLVSLDTQMLTPTHYETLGLALDYLIQYDANLKPQPMLAESWDLSPDYKRLQFNLRKGVQWHNGRDFTSEDVKYSVLRPRDLSIGLAQFNVMSSWWTSIETPDKYTIVLQSDLPRIGAMDMFEWLRMVDQGTLEGPNSKTTVVGTGPFTFVEWQQGDHLTMARNKNYWQSGKPYLDEMRAMPFKDTAAMLTQFDAGSLDFVRNPPWRDLKRMAQDPRDRIISHDLSGWGYMVGANAAAPPTDNQQVRQALNYAIDRKRFTDSVMAGYVEPSALPWTRTSPAFDAARNARYGFDLDKSKALLTEAGASNLELDFLVSTNYPDLLLLGQIYQSDLASIGVKLNLRPMEQPVYQTTVGAGQYTGLYSTLVGGSQGADPTLMFIINGTLTTSGRNSSQWKSDQYAQLVAAAGSEPENSKRQQLYTQLNDFLLDESVYMFLSASPLQAAVKSNVQDVRLTMHGCFGLIDTFVRTG